MTTFQCSHKPTLSFLSVNNRLAPAVDLSAPTWGFSTDKIVHEQDASFLYSRTQNESRTWN